MRLSSCVFFCFEKHETSPISREKNIDVSKNIFLQMRLVDASTNSILNFSIFAWRENDTVAKFCLKFCMPEDVSVYEDLF